MSLRTISLPVVLIALLASLLAIGGLILINSNEQSAYTTLRSDDGPENDSHEDEGDDRHKRGRVSANVAKAAARSRISSAKLIGDIKKALSESLVE